MMKTAILALLFSISFSILLNGQNPKGNRFKMEIDRFETLDTKGFDTTNLVLFIGSSTFTQWNDLASYFPESNALNRGFGGSQLTDVLYNIDKVLYRYQPKQIVFYEGDNDISAGIPVKEIYNNLLVFLRLVEIRMPNTSVILISVKHCPARSKFRSSVTKYNKLMKKLAEKRINVEFVDVSRLTLNKDGSYKTNLFKPDGIHVTPECYKLYAKEISPFLIKKN